MRTTRQRTAPASSLGLQLGEKKHPSRNRQGISSTEEEYLKLDDIRGFLEHGEKRLVDFKRQQYPIIGDGNTDENNAAFVKDVLSLANTPRETTAYILIGVDEEKHSIPGIPRKHVIDDAILQQKVNSKTNHPIEFFTYSIRVNRTRVVQAIAIASRGDLFPFYSMKPLPLIKVKTIYFRQGTSNTEATHDDVVQLTKDWNRIQNKPIVAVELVSPNLTPDGRFLTFDFVPVRRSQTTWRSACLPVIRNPDGSDTASLNDKWRIAAALSFVKVALVLTNQSRYRSLNLKTVLELEQTKPWTGLLVDVQKLFAKDPTETWTLPHKRIEEEVPLVPGERKKEVCPLVFDTNGPGEVTLRVFISGDEVGVVVDKSFTFRVVRTKYTFVDTPILPILMPRDEARLFSFVQDQVREYVKTSRPKKRRR